MPGLLLFHTTLEDVFVTPQTTTHGPQVPELESLPDKEIEDLIECGDSNG